MAFSRKPILLLPGGVLLSLALFTNNSGASAPMDGTLNESGCKDDKSCSLNGVCIKTRIGAGKVGVEKGQILKIQMMCMSYSFVHLVWSNQSPLIFSLSLFLFLFCFCFWLVVGYRQDDGKCQCYPGWTGDLCQTLDIVPTPRDSG